MSDYHDIDGNPITLQALCRTEPEWAKGQIERLTESNTILEHRLADSHRNVDALKARVDALETALREIALDSSNPTNQRTWAAERADKALAATKQEGEI